MENRITYDKLFNVIKIQNVVIFEDNFSISSSKNEVCYGLVRMSLSNRKLMFSELNKIEPNGKSQIEHFLNEFDKVFEAIENWENEIPYNDIETAFDIIKDHKEYEKSISTVIKKYSEIDMDNWEHKEDALTLLATYGSGIEIPNIYEELFEEFVFKKSRWESFRIFRDFSVFAKERFIRYMQDDISDNGMKLCIIDHQLCNGKCANEIVECIEKMQVSVGRRQNTIGLIYSSFDNKDCINDKVYFEYISKNASKKEFQAALTKSAYSYMLSKLKNIYRNVLEESFDEATRSKYIAYYLSCMADCEGITNYQVITNWIKLLFEYKLSGTQELTSLAGLTRLIKYLEDESVTFSKDMLGLNTFEAFDFSINKYREPIASGDIFVFKRKIFILVGQDCDLMNSTTRTRKNGISELVTADTVKQENVDNTVKLNSQYIFISNFRKKEDTDVKTLKIKYSSREFIDNQILQLCQFNDEGNCILDTNETQYKESGVEPEYYVSLYEKLVTFYKALLQIENSDGTALELVLNDSQSGRAITLTQYDKTKEKQGVIDYKIHRICRLKRPYMLYLYKMYLEYQGRHPFDCMNMSRVQEMQVQLLQDELFFIPVDMVLTPDREMNRSNVEKMDWYIDAASLENAVSHILGTSVEIKCVDNNIEINEMGKEYQYIINGDTKVLRVMKVDDKVSIEALS